MMTWRFMCFLCLLVLGCGREPPAHERHSISPSKEVVCNLFTVNGAEIADGTRYRSGDILNLEIAGEWKTKQDHPLDSGASRSIQLLVFTTNSRGQEVTLSYGSLRPKWNGDLFTAKGALALPDQQGKVTFRAYLRTQAMGRVNTYLLKEACVVLDGP